MKKEKKVKMSKYTVVYLWIGNNSTWNWIETMNYFREIPYCKILHFAL